MTRPNKNGDWRRVGMAFSKRRRHQQAASHLSTGRGEVGWRGSQKGIPHLLQIVGSVNT